MADNIGARFDVEAGQAGDLGAVFDGGGTNFALFSASAERVELCLYDPSGKVEIATCAVRAAGPAALRKKLNVPAEVSDAIVVTVQDSGIGIPKEDQMRVFSKFFRARNAKDQWVDGTGIGLTLAKLMIEAHGGRIWFRSDVGKGSLFCVSIPIDRQPAVSTKV